MTRHVTGQAGGVDWVSNTRRGNLTGADKAYQRIKEKIVTIEMRPGSVIEEAHLMKKLELGRTPIREALKRLQADNLVIVKPRRGMFVAEIAITDLTKIFEVRIELESLAARLAALRATPEQLAGFRQWVGEYEHTDHEDKKAILELDCRFHSMVAHTVDNILLENELELFHNLSLRIWHLALNYFRSDDMNVHSHLDLVAAIEAHDPVRAGEVMRSHIEEFHKTIKQYL